MSVRNSWKYQPLTDVELDEIVVHEGPVEATGSGIHPVEATGSGITTASEAADGDNGQGGNTFLKPESRNGKKQQNDSKDAPEQHPGEQSGAREDDQRQPEARTGTGRPSGQQLVSVREVDAQLHEACQTVNSKLVSELLGKGANPNALIDDLTPLDVTGEKIPPTHSSPLESFLEVITALIKVGGKPSGVDGAKYRETPLHVAVSLACEDSQHCSECSVCAQCLRAIHLLCEAGYTELLHGPRFQSFYIKLSPRSTEKEVYTALHAAVAKRWLNGVTALIAEGADVNAMVIVPAYKGNGAREKFNRSETVLHLAVYLQWLAGVIALLKSGAKTSAKLSRYAGGHTPLHMASQKLNVACIKTLLDHGADMNATNALKLTPLDVLGSNSETKSTELFLEALQVLIDNGSRPSFKSDVKYQTPLHTAVSLNCIQAVHELHKVGYKLHQNKKGDTPLHEVVKSCSEMLLKEFVSLYKDAALDGKNNMGETALHIAVKKSWLIGVTTLLENGADLTAKTTKRRTVLHFLPYKKNHAILKELLKHKDCHKIINERDNENQLPLFLAIKYQNESRVFLLVSVMADITLTAENNANVVHSVVKTQQWRILKGLFKKKKHDMDKLKESIISTKKLKNATPLHIAAFKNSSKCVEILVDNGCNLMIKAEYESKMYTPLELAIMKGYPEVVKIMLDKKPSLVNEPDTKGLMPIHWASILHNSEVIRIIVDHGCDLAARCSLSDHSSEVTAMDLFINRVPGAVDLLENMLDDAITVQREGIVLDYKILLPEIEGDARKLRVLDSLVQTGNQVDKVRLFTHPTVESFLAIQWERMKKYYYLLLGMFLFFLIVPFHVLVFIIFYSKVCVFNSVVTIITALLMISVFIIFFVCEILYFCLRTSHSKYFGIWKFDSDVLLYHFQSFLWIIKIAFMMIVFIYPLVRQKAAFSQELAICVIILLWVQFMYLVSRIPVYGIYMLMFFEVTSNFIVVMLSFIPIIFAFVTLFFIEYQGSSPFNTIPEAFLKTIVMMTSELEYSELFKNIGENSNVHIFTKVVFLLFLLVVGIVIMNIVLAKAILDVKKVDRLRKLAEFLSTCEQFSLCLYSLRNWLRKRLCYNLTKKQSCITEVNPILCIKFDESNIFPDNVMRSIMGKAYAVNKLHMKKEKEDRPTLETNHNKASSRNNCRKENVSTFDIKMYEHIQENTEKINELKHLMEQILQKSNTSSSSLST